MFITGWLSPEGKMYNCEYDGEQHFKPVFNFDTEESFKKRQCHDKEKNKYCFDNNITLIRIPYIHYNNLCLNDLLENSQFIIKKEVI